MAGSRRRRAIALAVSLLVLIGAALAVMLQRAPRRAGTNYTPLLTFGIPLEPGRQLCEPGELIPADTAGLRLFARSSSPSGPLSASVLGPHSVLSQGRLAGGWRPGNVTIPVGRIPSSVAGAVCVRNEGSSPVLFGGAMPDPGFVVGIDGKPLSARLRIDYMRPGSESWFDLLTVLTYRFSLGRSSLTASWAAAAVLVLMLAVVALTARILLRREGGGA